MPSPYNYLDFYLSDEFIAEYENKPVPWGYQDAAGNSLGEITFLRSYSRLVDGHKERWFETCRRVTEGTYHEQRKWCKNNRLPWNWKKATASAKEFYDRMFNMKWLPPGRGLWAMGTEHVHVEGNSAALQNCAYISTSEMTKDHPELPFAFMMEASMLGVGVGFDTRAANKFKIYTPQAGSFIFVVPDSREGWTEALSHILRAYLIPNQTRPRFDFTLIRPEGAPIKRFGGTAPGPQPLIKLIAQIEKLLDSHAGEMLSTALITDLMNMIGVCVVSGNIRRSAELALGSADDEQFLNLKNYEKNPYRMEWGWMSNNSIDAKAGAINYDNFVENILANGEPGFVYTDLMRSHGRLIDPANNKDQRAKGTNPCAEQTLESWECCTLVETFPTNCKDMADYIRTLKYAYLYAKTVTLIPTHWPETNAVMQRNRRIGLSMSGMAQFVESTARNELRTWMDLGYNEVQKWDRIYSEWLGVRESIKTTSVKPSGSVSLLAGVTPGVHWPVETQYIRRIIFSKTSPMIEVFRAAGYNVVPSVYNPDADMIVEFPIRGVPVRPEREVSVFEKADLAALAQLYWADNQVSCTITFDREKEGQYIPVLLRMFEGRLKSISFLPMDKTAYQQMPYEAIDDLVFEEMSAKLKPVDWSKAYFDNKIEAEGEKYCTTDVCEIRPAGK